LTEEVTLKERLILKEKITFMSLSNSEVFSLYFMHLKMWLKKITKL